MNIEKEVCHFFPKEKEKEKERFFFFRIYFRIFFRSKNLYIFCSTQVAIKHNNNNNKSKTYNIFY